MTADFKIYSKATERSRVAAVFLLATALAFAVASPTAAQSSGCKRAQAIVDDVVTLPATTAEDHREILSRLETAKRLCPSLGELWRLAYCSASALGDAASLRKAEVYRKRAALSGVKDFACGDGGKPPASPPLPSYVRQKFALVVGIGRFADSAIPTLRYTAKDARDFADYLIEKAHFPAQNVTLLTDENASRENILRGLQGLVLEAHEDDLVVLYVSSHGSPQKESRGLGGIGYIVTHDTALDSIYVDAIDYQDFARKTSLIKARRTVAFFDTCFSGQAFDQPGAKQLTVGGVGLEEKTAQMFLSGEGSYVIASSQAEERSWESDELENSYFTYYLIQALEKGDEPRALGEVFEELSIEVARAVAREKGVAQSPQMYPKDARADVRIGVIPRAWTEPER